MLNKNQIIKLTCESLGAELEGVCHYNGQTIFVEGVLPGEAFDAKILKTKKNYAFAKAINFDNKSGQRREPFCPVYNQCGGCSGQHMSYQLTLEAKKQQVFNCLTRIAKIDIDFSDMPDVLGAKKPLHYRNKTSLPVNSHEGITQLGFYKKRSHDIVPITQCDIAMGDIQNVIKSIKEWIKTSKATVYDETTHEGLLRHVVIRTSTTGKLMLLLVVTSNSIPEEKLLVDLLKQYVPSFSSLHVSLNQKHNNVILGDTSTCLYGEDSINETLLELTYTITPLSFFQVNPAQTQVLCAKVLEFSKLTNNDVVIDAYAGAGTLSLGLAKHCKKLIGLEIVPQAVQSAKINAEQNNITNAQFHVAAVEDYLPKLINDGLRPDVVVLDPPRKGIEEIVISSIIKAQPKRIVYVSCHVPSQARDIALLIQGGYKFVKCQPVDMFCYTAGVENIVVLEM